jgi:hypothetical protein
MKTIRTLWRSEEVEVEKQITITELEKQDKKFIVVELDEDDVNMITRMLHVKQNSKGVVIGYRPSSMYMRGWPTLVKKIEKAWNK